MCELAVDVLYKAVPLLIALEIGNVETRSKIGTASSNNLAD